MCTFRDWRNCNINDRLAVVYSSQGVIALHVEANMGKASHGQMRAGMLDAQLERYAICSCPSTATTVKEVRCETVDRTLRVRIVAVVTKHDFAD